MNRYAVGIDVGTTYSAVGIADESGASVLDLGQRQSAVPSVVALTDTGEVVVGESADRRSRTAPERSAREFKRRMGDPAPLLLGGTPYGAESLTAEMLVWIRDRCIERMGGPPERWVIAHPANWGPHKLDLLREACRIARLDPVELVQEPVAAAAYYSSQERVEDGDLIGVFDLGGGTFDAAVVVREGEGFSVKGDPQGLDRFGGIDLDVAVYGHVQSVLAGALEELDSTDPTVRSALAQLREECRLAKEALSSDTEVAIPVALPNLHTQVRLTREQFEDLIRPRLRDAVDSFKRAVESAGIELESLSRILLVGGSSRVPLVADLLREETAVPLAVDAHPKNATCLGASITGSSFPDESGPEKTPVAAPRVVPAASTSPEAGSPIRSESDGLNVSTSGSFFKKRWGLLASGALVTTLVIAGLVFVLDSPPGVEDSAGTSLGDSDDASASTSTPSTTIASQPSTTLGEAVYVFDPDSGGLPQSLPGSAGAMGSGCSPDSFTSFSYPDGAWFGYIDNIASDQFRFELACLWAGSAPEASLSFATSSSIEELVVTEAAPQVLARVRVDPATSLLTVALGSEAEVDESGYAEWAEDEIVNEVCAVTACPIWLFINDGAVTEVIQLVGLADLLVDSDATTDSTTDVQPDPTTPTTTTPSATVPLLVGLTRSEATQLLSTLSITWEAAFDCYDHGAPDDLVTGQSHPQGDTVVPGEIVFLSVNRWDGTTCGGRLVGNYVGLLYLSAAEQIPFIHLKPAADPGCYDNEVDYGIVVWQEPLPGSRVPTGGSVVLGWNSCP